jgi:hypothetical protein
MKNLLTVLFITVLSMTIMAQRSIDSQLKLRFDENYVVQLKEVSPKHYKFYVQELFYSYEFVELQAGEDYPVLVAFDYHANIAKQAPLFINFKTFSLYDYKFNRHPTEDVIYRIPNSDNAETKGIIIYSKEKFTNKL